MKERVDLNEKDINFFKFLYKHRHANLKTIGVLYADKLNTLYRRLKKLTEFNYIKNIKVKNMETLFALSFEGYKTLSKIEPEKEHRKINITEKKIPLKSNANHSLIIAEIGALLNIRGINYEIDLNLKAIYPEWKLIPDILIEKIGFEVELENKNMVKYRKKLSELQKTKEIAKLIYISASSTESLRRKITGAGAIIQKTDADTDIIINSTMEKIDYIGIKDFMSNIDEYLNKLNLAAGAGRFNKEEK